MSVLSCKEKYGSGVDISTKGDKRYSKTFLIETTSENDRELSILNSPLVPKFYTFWSAANDGDITAILDRIRLTEKEDAPLWWEAEVEYSTQPGGEDRNPNQPPLDRPPEVEYSWASGKKVATGGYISLGDPDRGRNGIVNSAGELFDPPPEIDDDRLVLTIRRNEPIFDATQAIKFANTTNKTAFSGAEPGQVLMKPWRAVRQFEQGQLFWRVTYEMHFNADGWKLKLLDHGSYYWLDNDVGTQEKKRRFTDEPGNPTTGLLNKMGGILVAGAAHEFVEFDVYEENDFNTLNLPVPAGPPPVAE